MADSKIKNFVDKECINLVVERWETYVKNSSVFRKKLVERYKQYRGIQSRKNYEGLANVFVNETLQAVESIVSQMYVRLFNESRYLYLKGTEETDLLDASITENLLMMTLEDINFKSKILDALRQCVIYGTVFCRVFWKTITKYIFERVELEDGTFRMEETKKYIYDNPDIEVIDLMDIAFQGGRSRIEDMEWIIIRKRVSWDYIVDRKNNVIYGGEIETLKKSDKATKSSSEPLEKNQKTNYSGINSQVSEDNNYEILEMWGRIPRWFIEEDINMESKEAKEMVDGVIEVVDKKMVVRRARNPYYHQEIPGVLGQFIRIDNEVGGIGVVEICESLQNELNDKRNQLLDHASLSILPPLVKNRGAGIKNENIKLRPHYIIPSDIAGDAALSPLRIGGNPQEIIAMDSIIKQDIRNEAGASNPQQGIKSPGETTAYETSILDQRASSRINLYTSEFAGNILKPMYRIIYKLLYQYMDKERVVKIVGKDGIKWHKKKPEDLLADMDFSPKLSTDADSRVIVRNQLIQFLTAIAKYYPQVNAYLLVRRIYSLFGEEDVDEVIPKPDSERGQNELREEEEMLVLSLGQKIDAKYYEDHPVKIDAAVNWLRTNQGNLTDAAREAFEDYIAQHTQYLKVLESAQSIIRAQQGQQGQNVRGAENQKLPLGVKPPLQNISESQASLTKT